jgi:hypothetical protein
MGTPGYVVGLMIPSIIDWGPFQSTTRNTGTDDPVWMNVADALTTKDIKEEHLLKCNPNKIREYGGKNSFPETEFSWMNITSRLLNVLFSLVKRSETELENWM